MIVNIQVLEPIFEPMFHPSSHGFRRDRGAHTAIAEAKRYVEQGYGIVVDLDLSRFFDRVNHQRLLNRLGQRVADGRILKLVHRMLRAKVVMPDGTRVSTEEGMPQGGPLSPLLSNVVLDELDQELERRGLHFVRYADDANIFVRSRRAGHRVLESTRRFIEGRLRLKLNEEKTTVDRPGKLHFPGLPPDAEPGRAGRGSTLETQRRAAEPPHPGADAPDVGSVGRSLLRAGEPLPAWVAWPLPDLHRARSPVLPQVRCSPSQATANDHPAAEGPEGSLPVPSSASAWRSRGRGRMHGVLSSRAVESQQPAGADPGVSQCLVQRAAGLAVDRVAPLQPSRAGLGPAVATVRR